MKTASNKSLKEYNTFGVDVTAKTFISVETVEDLKTVLKKTYASELFILGGGSNMLLTKNIDATVLHLDIKGKKILEETEDYAIVQAKAGENWHEFVLWTIEQGLGGLENLSLIPGNVGTSPIQNIGAYGKELKDTFHECEAVNIQTLETKIFKFENCAFGYRDSVFKNELKDQYIITSVSFSLSKNNHQINTSYGTINEALEKAGIQKPTIKDVSNAVISIRQEKLPNPKELGNSGSFFKNPIISKEQFSEIQKKFPNIPSYEVSETEVKVPAGWLIDQAGLKGYRKGDAGVHKNQALVLVNYGNATGKEILSLAHEIIAKVKERYGITLEPEVNVF